MRIGDCFAVGTATAVAVARLNFDSNASADADAATDMVDAWEVTLGTLADVVVPAPFKLTQGTLIDAD